MRAEWAFLGWNTLAINEISGLGGNYVINISFSTHSAPYKNLGLELVNGAEQVLNAS